MSLQQIYLVVISVGLIPISMGYGLSPKKVLSKMFGFNVNDNGAHIFRAVMGLYFGMIALWVIGIINPLYTNAAILASIFFMLGLASGRLLSFFYEGQVSLLLKVYFVLEVVIGVIGIILL
ncbi:DUF4345 domain-containing protein [Vibrio mediterranei]|uniref:DUF4345 domain-containing protein n=1 Tax=Vibrio mediterranei TaxID=689 RepID=UPI00148B5900|nr:DUF4345 domain-containing protein [Vibrio mediterranei]NOH31720.1 DUF4345 domain-containing protein [Vibrio mediterranei]